MIADEDQLLVDDDQKVVMIEVIEEISLKYVQAICILTSNMMHKDINQEFMKASLLKLAQALRTEEAEDNLKATLHLFRSILIDVELESRPESYKGAFWRNGIEVASDSQLCPDDPAIQDNRLSLRCCELHGWIS